MRFFFALSLFLAPFLFFLFFFFFLFFLSFSRCALLLAPRSHNGSRERVFETRVGFRKEAVRTLECRSLSRVPSLLDSYFRLERIAHLDTHDSYVITVDSLNFVTINPTALRARLYD